jgi:periplasmic divalent cation tolerance protein
MILLYSTFPNLKSAQKIAKKLVEKKQVACANILPAMYSIYPWDKKIAQEKEVVAIFKTTKKYFSSIEKEFSKNHPYKVFCLIEIPLKRVSKSYSQWLEKNLVY